MTTRKAESVSIVAWLLSLLTAARRGNNRVVWVPQFLLEG